ncbi:MAG: 4-hydroxy-tetrahydrodipicolinate synthase [Opitutales bacterium]|nr:4-hydroxy-tetrahydrodipicolinate synthase [Opitutales bacterium]
MNTQQNSFKGAFTALVTPMVDGRIAYDELDALVERQIEGGIDGLVPVGTTGESPTLGFAEHIEVVKRVVKKVNGRVPVIAGAGANSTEEALHLTREADNAGADALLHVTPYYNKPSQEGMFRHFGAVAQATKKPIVLYSIPGRAVVEMTIPTLVRLVDSFANITTIKESGGKVFRASQIIDALGDRLGILSGEDEHTIPYMSVGAQGVISVASNLVPDKVSEMVHAALKGDFVAAQAMHKKLYPLFRDLFVEPNPVPCKYAMMKHGILTSDSVRLPLSEMQPASRAVLDATLAKLA